MSLRGHHHPKPRLPVELFRPIAQFVETGGLYALCTVSRDMRYESQHILYRYVDLGRRSEKQVNSWALVVGNHPHLAEMLISLRLPTTRRDISDTGWLAVLARALQAAVNLKSFSIQNHPDGDFFDLSVFSDCRLRLHKFNIDSEVVLRKAGSLGFYTRQSDIYDWSADAWTWAWGRPFDSLPPHLLPHLSVVDIPLFSERDLRFVRFLARRPLERVCLDVSEYMMGENLLKTGNHFEPAKGKVTHLSVFTDAMSPTLDALGLQPWSSVDIVESLSSVFPRLKLLSFCPSNRMPKCHGHSRERLITLLSNLRELETFIVNPLLCNLDACDDARACSSWSLDSEQGCLAVAEDLMSSSPSLRHIAFSTENREGSAYRSYVRSREGKVSFMGLNCFNQLSWRDM